MIIEELVQRRSVKKVFSKILQNSQENTSARVFDKEHHEKVSFFHLVEF